MARRCRIYLRLLLALTFLPVGQVYATPPSSERLTALEEQVRERQQEHKKLQAEALKLNLDLNKLNQQSVVAAKKLQTEEAQTTKTEEELKVLQEQLKEAEDRFGIEHQKLADMLGALENLALHPTHSMLVMPLSPVEVVRSALLMRESVPYLEENATEIKKNLEELSKRQKAVQAKLDTLAKQKKSLLAQQENLKKLTAQKTALRQKIEGESKKNKDEAQRLAAQASDLRDLLEKAEKEQELRRRKQEERRRVAKQREEEARQKLEAEQKKRIRQGISDGFAEDQTETVRLTAKQSTGKPLNFKGAYGRLTKPARGSVLTAYGEELSKGVSSKGLVIKTRAGAQVVAPYDGTVIFSGPFKGYGNLIIVEHGQGYVSLLAGMNSVETETGQMVLTGEPVGVMPDRESAKLYIEIRQNSRPINPAPWFGSMS